MVRALALAVLATLLLTGTTLAGQFYLHDDDEYYWYIQEEPAYEVAVPATGEAYVQRRLFGEDVLEILVAGDGPLLRLGVVSGNGGDVDRVWQAVQGEWGHRFSSINVTDDRDITTGTGLTARFKALSANTPTGRSAMVRAVFFTQDDTLVYLIFVGDANQYDGDNRRYWLQAVNSFEWY